MGFAKVLLQRLRLLLLMLSQHWNVLVRIINVKGERGFDLHLELDVERETLVLHGDLTEVHLHKSIRSNLEWLNILPLVLLTVDVWSHRKPKVKESQFVRKNFSLVIWERSVNVWQVNDLQFAASWRQITDQEVFNLLNQVLFWHAQKILADRLTLQICIFAWIREEWAGGQLALTQLAEAVQELLVGGKEVGLHVSVNFKLRSFVLIAKVLTLVHENYRRVFLD